MVTESLDSALLRAPEFISLAPKGEVDIAAQYIDVGNPLATRGAIVVYRLIVSLARERAEL